MTERDNDDDDLLLLNGRAVSSHAVDLLDRLDRRGFALRVVGDRVLCEQARKLDPDTRWYIQSREPDLLALLQAEPDRATH